MARRSVSDEQIERLYKEMFHKLYVYALRIMRDPSLARGGGTEYLLYCL